MRIFGANMKRIGFVLLVLMMCAAIASASETYRTFFLGNINYEIPAEWAYQYSEEYDMHYHLETMEPWNSRSLSVQKITADVITSNDDATAFFASLARGMTGENEMEQIDIKVEALNRTK